MEKYFVKIDDREPKAMDKFFINKNLVPVRVRMDVGDYVWEDVVVERKTVEDFCGSIMDGRIKEQAEKMKKYGKRFVVIIGDLDKRVSKINKNCLMGKMVSMMIDGVMVIQVSNEMEFVWVMRNVIEKYAHLNGGSKEG